MTTAISIRSPFIENAKEPYQYNRKTASDHFSSYTKAYNRLFNTSFSEKELETIMAQ